jgi:hypothetical protein
MRSGVTLAVALSGLVMLVGAPSSALAQNPPPAAVAATAKHDLDEADAAYEHVDFEGAGKLAQRALDRRGLTHEELVRGYRMLARVDAVLDRDDESRAAFVMLLTLSPDEKGDKNLPPKMTDRLAEARGVVSAFPVRPGIETTATLRRREGGAVRVSLRDPTHLVRHVRVAYRWSDEGAFATSSRDAAESISVEIPAPPAGASRFDFYADALDDHDSVVFENGTPATPITTSLALVDIAPQPPPRVLPLFPPPRESTSRSVFASPVFWAVAAGVVVAGGVILFAATRPGSASSVSLSPSLDCGGVRCN